MADRETIAALLDNKYVLFGLIGVAVLLGQVVKIWLARYKDKLKDQSKRPQ